MVTITQRFSPSKHLETLFEKLGRIISRYPFWSIAIPVVLTLITSYGLYIREQSSVSDPRALYIPSSAQGFKEEQQFYHYWPLSSNRFVPFRTTGHLEVSSAVVVSWDESNILTSEKMARIRQFNDEALKISSSDRVLENITFDSLCVRWEERCGYRNEHVLLFQHLLNTSEITYPVVTPDHGYPVYIGTALGGVKVSKRGRVLSAKAIFLLYYLTLDDRKNAEKFKWENDFIRACEKANRKFGLRFACFHSRMVIKGLQKTSDAINRKFIISVILIAIFAALSGLQWSPRENRSLCFIDFYGSKDILSLAGLLVTGFSIGITIGGIVLLGYHYDVIVTIAPFLILAIGVDDMFIMISAWRRSDIRDTVSDRMAFTMKESAVSITFTSLTSAASFAVGCTSNILVIRLFCCYTAVGIIINYVYQITFFAGCMVYSGRVEQHRSFKGLFKGDDHSKMSENSSSASSQEVSPAISTIQDELRRTSTLAATNQKSLPMNSEASWDPVTFGFQKAFGDKLLLCRTGKLTAGLLALLYWSLSVWGIFQLKVGFKPQSLFTNDHMGKLYFDLVQKHFWSKGWPLEVLINSPGDLSSPVNRQLLLEIERQFDSTHCSLSMNGEQFWLARYIKFVGRSSRHHNRVSTWTRQLQSWTHLNSVQFSFSQDLAWRGVSETERVDCQCNAKVAAFRFRIALQNYSTSQQQVACQRIMRDLAARYPTYNITTYTTEWPWCDQYRMITPLTIKNIAMATGCMILISLVFLHDLGCLLAIGACIVSMNFGVLGFMGWWSVRLDIISMITILMSIGLSVDYSAHIAYAFKTSKKSTARERVLAALGDVGLPVFQGALSTFLGVLALAFTGTYMGTSFFKVVFIVIIVGALHGCIFLPVLFSLADELSGCCSAARNRVSNNSVHTSTTVDLPSESKG